MRDGPPRRPRGNVHRAASARARRAACGQGLRIAHRYQAELEAFALVGEDGVTATGWPPRELTIDVTVQRLWGVTIALPSGMTRVGARPISATVGGLVPADPY